MRYHVDNQSLIVVDPGAGQLARLLLACVLLEESVRANTSHPGMQAQDLFPPHETR